jgi:Flp pilus assembly protein TadG
MTRTSRMLGIAAVEMAIVLPLLLLLLTPVAELGRAFIQYSRLSHRVQAGARFVADNAYQGSTGVPSLTPEVQQRAINLVLYGRTASSAQDTLAVPGLTAQDLFVEVTAGGRVTLSADYTYQPMIAGLLPLFGFADDLDISALRLQPRAVMRAL